MIAVATNGYTQDQVLRAIRGYYGELKVRRRVELLDFNLNRIRDLENVVDAEVQEFADKDIPLTCNLDIREANISLDTYSQQLISMDGLLFYLKLGEASGAAADSSGNGRTFTANGTPTYSQGSLLLGDVSNNSILFNGTNSYFSIADAAWMDVTTGLTLGAWVKTSTIPAAGTAGTIIARAGTGTPAFAFRTLTTTGYLELLLRFSSTNVFFTTTSNICDGKPHFVCATYDGAFVRIFIDSVQVLKTAETRSIDNGAVALTVGATAAPANYFTGNIDEAFMASRGISVAEVRNLYQAGVGNYSEILYEQDLIKLYYAIKMPFNGTDGEPWAEYPLGVFKPVIPSRITDKTGVYRKPQGFGWVTHTLANSQFGTRYTISSGTNYITAVLALIAAAGLATTSFTVTPTSHTLPATVDFEQDSNVLVAINKLLFEIAYDPIRDNETGGAVIAPMVLPSARPSEIELKTDMRSVIGVNGELLLSTDRVPNKIIVTIEDADRAQDKAEETNSKVTSPVSTVYKGTKAVIVPTSAVNTTVGSTLAKNILEAKTAKAYAGLRFPIVPMPFFGYKTRATIEHAGYPYAFGIRDEFICESWKLRLSEPPQMMDVSWLVVAGVTS